MCDIAKTPYNKLIYTYIKELADNEGVVVFDNTHRVNITQVLDTLISDFGCMLLKSPKGYPIYCGPIHKLTVFTNSSEIQQIYISLKKSLRKHNILITDIFCIHKFSKLYAFVGESIEKQPALSRSHDINKQHIIEKITFDQYKALVIDQITKFKSNMDELTFDISSLDYSHTFGDDEIDLPAFLLGYQKYNSIS
jgi:hypothetical protein